MLIEKFSFIAQIGHEATLWILVVLSVLSIAFIIERFIALKAAEERSREMIAAIATTLEQDTLKEFGSLPQDSDTLEGRAFLYGMRHVEEYGSNGLEEVFNAYVQVERPQLEKRLNFLATVGSNAPFIGLLGTVFGIMDAFRSLATSQGEVEVVLVGISQALVATAAGLIVAIPAVIAYNIFQKKVRRILQGLDCVRDICVAYSKARSI